MFSENFVGEGAGLLHFERMLFGFRVGIRINYINEVN